MAGQVTTYFSTYFSCVKSNLISNKKYQVVGGRLRSSGTELVMIHIKTKPTLPNK